LALRIATVAQGERGLMDFSVGVGLTNACDLACAHCYRDTDRIDQLTLRQVTQVCDALSVRSVNLGTGENGLHPEYPAIVRALAERGVKLSLTSNGFTIERCSNETLAAFREVEVSIDFPTEAEQDAFRGPGNWRRVMAGIARAQGLGITVTVLTVMMKTNYRRLPEIARVAFEAGANYRVNVYQPVKTDAFTLSYDEFWDGFRRLLAATRLVGTTEPILNAMLGAPFLNGSGCGRQTVRVTPKGDIVPCVYWRRSDLRVEDLPVQGGDGVLASSQFSRVRTIPEVCRGCPFVDSCHGGCAGRRELASGVEMADPYCPLVRGDRVDLEWAPAESRELLKAGSACTSVFAPP
jgi:radical SAM protein with 4Fe4S-binding SPASM domain